MMMSSVQSSGRSEWFGADFLAKGVLASLAASAIAMFSACSSPTPSTTQGPAPSTAAGAAAPAAATAGMRADAPGGVSATGGTPSVTPTAAAGPTTAAGGASPAGGAAGAVSTTAGTSAASVAGMSAAGSSGMAATAGASGAAAGSAAPTGPATFTAVLAIFADTKNNCGLCHSMATIGGGLVFKPTDKQGTFSALVGVTSKGMSGSQCAGKTYVVAGKPEASLLYDKLANATPSCGVRMPASGTVLTDAEIATVGAWISAGALNN